MTPTITAVPQPLKRGNRRRIIGVDPTKLQPDGWVTVGEVTFQGKFVCDIVRPWRLHKAVVRHEAWLKRKGA